MKISKHVFLFSIMYLILHDRYFEKTYCVKLTTVYILKNLDAYLSFLFLLLQMAMYLKTIPCAMICNVHLQILTRQHVPLKIIRYIEVKK